MSIIMERSGCWVPGAHCLKKKGLFGIDVPESGTFNSIPTDRFPRFLAWLAEPASRGSEVVVKHSFAVS